MRSCSSTGKEGTSVDVADSGDGSRVPSTLVLAAFTVQRDAAPTQSFKRWRRGASDLWLVGASTSLTFHSSAVVTGGVAAGAWLRNIEHSAGFVGRRDIYPHRRTAGRKVSRIGSPFVGAVGINQRRLNIANRRAPAGPLCTPRRAVTTTDRAPPQCPSGADSSVAPVRSPAVALVTGTKPE